MEIAIDTSKTDDEKRRSRGDKSKKKKTETQACFFKTSHEKMLFMVLMGSRSGSLKCTDSVSWRRRNILRRAEQPS